MIPGIEISCSGDAGEEIHMLGYYLNPEAPALVEALQKQQQQRVHRAQAILERLADLGAHLDWNAVLAQSAGESIGRPHVARALIQAGHVGSIHEAFDRYLRAGRPAYVAGKRLSPADAIGVIHAAGGVAVLAHPGLLSHPEQWAALPGLDGLEVMHPAHNSDTRANLRGLARRLGLIITGGSDFHRPEDALASQHIPPDTLRRLREQAERYRPSDNPG